MNIYIILTFFGHYSMLTAVYCVHKTCVNAPCRGYHRIFRIQSGKNSRQHFCFKLVNLYLLYEMRNRVWRDCKQLSLNKSMFSLKTFKASRCSNVRHITVSWVCNLVTLRLLRRQREYNPQFSGTFKAF